MIINIIILIIGFIVLIKGADLFVDAASSMASHFHISKMIIALTIVAFGTSAPELAVSIKSMLNGSGDIVLGNVIGSNILNILLILGISGCVHALNVKSATVKKELPITILITSLFVVLLSDKLLSGFENNLTRSDGITIILFFLIFIYYLIKTARNKMNEDVDEPKFKLFNSIFLTLVGILCLILGSNAVVESASFIASKLGVSQRLISLTIIALGTSLPELVTSVVATRKGEYDIAIGNVVGSNIFNIGIVIGIPVAIFGNINHISFSYVDLSVMILSAVLLLLFSFKDYKLDKKEAIMFLIVFLLYYSYVIGGV
ncbi:MAG: calcium/sodium antiporter [Bacilli bacterium]|nr:calcium/sodium antiporter [Bacilli bacterium]